MSIFPSSWLPPFPYLELPLPVRAAVGRSTLERIYREVWFGGVAAGRAEGIVGTSLVFLALAVAVLTVVVLIRAAR